MHRLRKRYYCEVEVVANETDEMDAQTKSADRTKWYEIPSAQDAMDATNAMVRLLEDEKTVGIVTIRIWTAIRAQTTTTTMGANERPWRKQPSAIETPERKKKDEWYAIGKATVIC